MFPENFDEWNVFAQEDPFNNNFVEGYVCRRNDNSYGAVYIQKVNDRPVPQLIYCTPKMRYPFDKNGNWHFPKAKQILRFTKLDGSNIFAYFYKDEKGEEHLTYKLRLAPFVRNSRFGPFLDMWREILKMKPHIEKFSRLSRFHASYELWGARNSHLIQYDVPLAASLLFIRHQQKIAPPQGLEFPTEDIAPFLGGIDRDYIWNYQESQRNLEANLKEVEDGYQGHEGEIWYLQTEDGIWSPLKLKPETIEQIHWAMGGIGKNVIITTCQNAFESWDNPTFENVVHLLEEEFPKEAIETVHDMIRRILPEVKSNFEFRAQVMEQYNELGMNILEDKTNVMRALSSKFKKDQMKKVYTVIMNHVVK